MCTEPVSSIVMYNLGVGHGGPYISANLEGPQSNLLFWGRAEAETKANRGPTPKLYITLLLTGSVHINKQSLHPPIPNPPTLKNA